MTTAILRSALVTPLTGPLARYGQASATALRLWAELAASLPPPWRRVELAVHDAHPNPAGAMRRAAADNPHVLFGPYGSSPAIRAIGASDRVVWNHGGATSRLAWPEFPRVVNVLAPAASYFAGALQAVHSVAPRAPTVAIFHALTGFARDVASGAAALAVAADLSTRTLAFAPGQVGSSAEQLPDADLLLVAAAFEEEVAAARVLLQRPWPAAAFVGAGVEDVLSPLGAKREGLLGPAQWSAVCAPEPDEGPDAQWFIKKYREATGKDPAYPAVQAFASGIVCARCIRDAGGVDDAELLAAAKRLRCTTLFGDFVLDPTTGHQVGHQVLTVQWQEGVRRVVWPAHAAEAPLVFPRSATKSPPGRPGGPITGW